MSFSYVAAYDSPNVHGNDDPSSQRPWNLTDEILKHAGQEINLLDIECGTAVKFVPLAPYFREIIALDISENMLNAARNNLTKNKISNIKLIHGDSNNLPYWLARYLKIKEKINVFNCNVNYNLFIFKVRPDANKEKLTVVK